MIVGLVVALSWSIASVLSWQSILLIIVATTAANGMSGWRSMRDPNAVSNYERQLMGFVGGIGFGVFLDVVRAQSQLYF